MASRTQLVCLCEGERGSIDQVFIRKLIRCLDPAWLRPWPGNNIIRIVPCGGRKAVVETMPSELRQCRDAGGDTTLMVWADLDDDRDDGEALKADFRQEAERHGISKEEFEQTVFVFAKDRLENWIEFLQKGSTDESEEGPRVRHDSDVAEAAKKLADYCKSGRPVSCMPPSLQWSCKNWRAFAERMK